MKVILVLIALVGVGSGLWWAVGGVSIDEQIEYVGNLFYSESASNTANSANKLGKVLKNNFEDAQEVYEHGAEAKYE